MRLTAWQGLCHEAHFYHGWRGLLLKGRWELHLKAHEACTSGYCAFNRLIIFSLFSKPNPTLRWFEAKTNQRKRRNYSNLWEDDLKVRVFFFLFCWWWWTKHLNLFLMCSSPFNSMLGSTSSSFLVSPMILVISKFVITIVFPMRMMLYSDMLWLNKDFFLFLLKLLLYLPYLMH